MSLAASQNFDLHAHSTVSDGLLSPGDLVRRAAERGVTALALTDHDEVSGVAEAREAADAVGIRLIAGVEISVTWGETTVHVVGLGIDPDAPALVAGLGAMRVDRTGRASRIAEALERIGIRGSLEGAYRHAGNPDLVGRAHFARFLVESGISPDVKTVFRHYLAAGKPGYVPHRWAVLADACAWIRGAGGVAVLAHPGRYKLSRREMQALLEAFKAAGGEAIEVVSGNHDAAQAAAFARMARTHGLAASRGSDFHGPGEGYAELGRLAALPADLEPVWARLPA
ncbi:MAG: PHP domain-containing protein [Burkholderiales bacterium]|nr:PHP domain-containing protein [Burkholderiales bacterium]